MTTAAVQNERVTTVPAYDLDRARADFPILAQKVQNQPLVYLDNAASTQKPRAVMDAIAACYGEYYANVERGVHTLSQASTAAREGARETVRRFLNAPSAEEIVFVRGTTEAINLVAASWGRRNVGIGDEIVVTELEHHSNIVPWQMLCWEKKAKLQVVPINDAGEVVSGPFPSGVTSAPEEEATVISMATHLMNVGGFTPVLIKGSEDKVGIVTVQDDSGEHARFDGDVLGLADRCQIVLEDARRHQPRVPGRAWRALRRAPSRLGHAAAAGAPAVATGACGRRARRPCRHGRRKPPGRGRGGAPWCWPSTPPTCRWAGPTGCRSTPTSPGTRRTSRASSRATRAWSRRASPGARG